MWYMGGVADGLLKWPLESLHHRVRLVYKIPKNIHAQRKNKVLQKFLLKFTSDYDKVLGAMASIIVSGL